jgi:uncharacterized protein YukE
MSFYGADVEQLRALSAELRQRSEELEAILARLSSRIEHVAWRGPDADRLRSEWQGSHVVAVRRAVRLLQDASGQALDNARQQDETSRGRAGSPSAATT